MLVVTTEGVAGRSIAEAIGVVRGSTVRAKHIGSDIVASLRQIVGGEVREYAALLAGAREQAYDRMVEDAQNLVFSTVPQRNFVRKKIMVTSFES